MYDPTIGTAACGGLDWLDGAVDFDDLAFLSMVLSLQESDQALIGKMREIRALNEQKRELNKDIQRLNSYLSRSSADKDGEFVYVGGGLEDPEDPTESGYPTPEQQRAHEKAWNDRYERAELRREGYTPGKEEKTPEGGVLDTTYMNEQRDLFRRSEVNNRIEELRGRLEDLNSSSSIMMIELQRIMNARQQSMQFVSTMESKSHQNSMAIINNMK